ncbi:unnamed protein product [Brassica rapa subsp. narinosa]|uniref:(rape) hypothetical protein n=1 Tax=Brassica napus TaxID=3708 RepID=A0A816XPB3_BRANA|nr:unnamed protein product [Brassica napus]
MRYRPKSIIYTVKCKPTLAFEEDKEERRWNLTETEENDDVLRDRCKWIRRFLLRQIIATEEQLWRGNERLRLFRVDLQDDGSFDDAIKGCDGVFHIAASMEFDISPNHVNLGTTFLFHKETGFESQSYVQGKVIDPAIKGVRNVLGSCLKSKSVKRVVFTSSISTLTSKDENERWRSITKNFTRLFSVYRVDDDLEERPGLMKPMISSKKLRKLGFQYKYGIEEIIHQQLMLL